MHMKLIIALVSDEITEAVTEAARNAGATGATTITSARGEGLTPEKTFLGLDLSGQRDILLFIVAGEKSRAILEAISDAGKFEEEPGSGIAFELQIEDAVGMGTQMPTMLEEVEAEV
jgi:nitrogen regulatory protein PII